jgi:hypothetical protein
LHAVPLATAGSARSILGDIRGEFMSDREVIQLRAENERIRQVLKFVAENLANHVGLISTELSTDDDLWKPGNDLPER